MHCSSLQVLSDSEVQNIHQCSLEILEEIGIRVHLKKMRTLLAEHGFQVDEDDRSVKFSAELIEKFLKKAPHEFILRGVDPDLQWRISPETRAWVGLGTPFRMLNAGGKRREATMQDVNEHLILFEHLEHICCSQMDIWPQDIPIHIYQAEAIHSWARNCTKPIGTGAYGVLVTQDFVDMVDLVTGGGDKIKARIERQMEGIAVNPATLAMDAIRRVGPEGDFLKERHTLNNIVPEHFIPSVSDRQPLETWKRGGQKGIIDHAADKVNAILENHRPVALDAGLDRELHAFVESVKKRSLDDYQAAEWEG